MGARIIVSSNPQARRAKENRTLALIIAAVAGPFLLTFLLIAADMRADLSELEPKRVSAEGGVSLVGWPTLGSHTRVDLPVGTVRMLGYMMDGYRPVPDGTPVKMFMLMPEAGQLLHPAHRIPDEMVEVWLQDGLTIPYRDRSMVWAQGLLRHRQPNAAEGIAAYAMNHALVESATDRDLKTWFVPPARGLNRLRPTGVRSPYKSCRSSEFTKIDAGPHGTSTTARRHAANTDSRR